MKRPITAPADGGPAPPPPDRTLRCRVAATGTAKPETRFGYAPPVDIHEALGLAEPAGATPSSLLLATLGTCLVERIRANAAIGNIALTNLVLEIQAELAVSPLWAAADAPGPAGIELIQVRIHMDADAPDDALHALVRHAMLWSPVANTLHAPIHLDVALVPRSVS